MTTYENTKTMRHTKTSKNQFLNSQNNLLFGTKQTKIYSIILLVRLVPISYNILYGFCHKKMKCYKLSYDVTISEDKLRVYLVIAHPDQLLNLKKLWYDHQIYDRPHNWLKVESFPLNGQQLADGQKMVLLP